MGRKIGSGVSGVKIIPAIPKMSNLIVEASNGEGMGLGTIVLGVFLALVLFSIVG